MRDFDEQLFIYKEPYNGLEIAHLVGPDRNIKYEKQVNITRNHTITDHRLTHDTERKRYRTQNSQLTARTQ